MQLGPFNFKPPLLALLATLLFASIFAGLGRWQLERMDQKNEIAHQHQTRATLPALTALPNSSTDFSELRFRKIQLWGEWLANQQFLLDNQVLNGRVGFNVLTPLVLADNRTVLVDRGWIALGNSRQDLPVVSISTDLNSIQGTIYVPFGEPFALGEATAGSSGWPRIIQYLDFAALSTVLGRTLLPVVVRMAAEQPNGYQRQWPAVPFSAQKHLAYAVQWFALAVAVVVLFLVLNLKRKR